MKLREYWIKKNLKQRIYLCIGTSLVLVFMFFFIKGNFFDKHISTLTATSETTQSSASAEDKSDENDGFELSDFPWIDVGILAVLFTAYGIHKYREKKRERRL